MDKTCDPEYKLRLARYHEAIAVIHYYEEIQHINRERNKIASGDKRILLRRALYKGRKTLARLNKQISAFCLYCQEHGVYSW